MIQMQLKEMTKGKAGKVQRLQELLRRHQINVRIYKDTTKKRAHTWQIWGMTARTALKLVEISEDIVQCTQNVGFDLLDGKYWEEAQDVLLGAHIWREFGELHRFITKGPKTDGDGNVVVGQGYIDTVENYRHRGMEWLRNLHERYGTEALRIYPHCLVHHTVPQYNSVGPLGAWSNEALEAAYKLHRILYYQHTQHDGRVSSSRTAVSSMEQVVMYFFRELLLSDGDIMYE